MAVHETDTDRLVIRVVYDGPGRAGKTTNIHQLRKIFGVGADDPELHGLPLSSGRTVHFDWLGVDGGAVDGHRLRIQIVAVPGHKSLEARRAHILRTADAVVLVCDSGPAGQDSARETLDSLREHLGARIGDVPLIVQANKQDLAPALTPRELGRELRLPDAVPVLAAQAAAGIGVRETAVQAVRAALRRVKRTITREGLAALAGRAGAAAALFAALDAIPAQAVPEDSPPPPRKRGRRGAARPTTVREGRVIHIGRAQSGSLIAHNHGELAPIASTMVDPDDLEAAPDPFATTLDAPPPDLDAPPEPAPQDMSEAPAGPDPAPVPRDMSAEDRPVSGDMSADALPPVPGDSSEVLPPPPGDGDVSSYLAAPDLPPPPGDGDVSSYLTAPDDSPPPGASSPYLAAPDPADLPPPPGDGDVSSHLSAPAGPAPPVLPILPVPRDMSEGPADPVRHFMAAPPAAAWVLPVPARPVVPEPSPLTADVAPGLVWPIPRGREILRALAGVPLQRLPAPARPPDDPPLVFAAGPWRLGTRASQRFEDLEHARAAIVLRARQTSACAALLPTVALAVQTEPDGASRLWHLAPRLEGVRERLRSCAPHGRPALLARLAAAVFAALRLWLRAGVGLDLGLASFAVDGGRVVHLGDPIGAHLDDPGAAILALCGRLSGDADLLAAWIDALEQELRDADPGDLEALGLAGALADAETRYQAVHEARARLLLALRGGRQGP